MGRPQCVEKASQSFVPAGTKGMKFVFCRGVYVAENTSRPASVEFVCRRQTNYARSRVQSFRKSGRSHFFDSLRSARRRSFNHISSGDRISSRDDREPAALRKSRFSQETSPFCRRSSRTMGMAMVAMTTALISPTPSRVTKSPNT